MTLAEYYINNANSSITSKTMISSYIYTFLYAIGIQDNASIGTIIGCFQDSGVAGKIWVFPVFNPSANQSA